MRIRLIYQILFSLFLVISGVACNSDSETDSTVTYSKDAQIYAISFAAIPRTSADTVAYKALSTTKFTIEQKTQGSLIYNSEPLPYGTDLRKYLPTITFAGGATNLPVEIVYPVASGDSTVTWNTSDSIDFSKKPILKVTAPDGAEKREYSIEFRRYSADPDSIIWEEGTALPQTGESKSLIVDNTPHAFVLNGSSVTLYKTSAWLATTTSGLPTDVIIKSINYANGKFVAIGTNGNAYASQDGGTTWLPASSGKNITAIYGVLPKGLGETEDNILVARNNGSETVFAKTKNMQDFVDITSISGETSANVPEAFATKGFSSFTLNSGYNKQVIIAGGTTASAEINKSIWAVNGADTETKIEITANNYKTIYDATDDVAILYYNNAFVAVVGNKLYTLATLGAKWVAAPEKQNIPSTLAIQNRSAVLVDNDNYIWIIGGSSTNRVVKGRMNIFRDDIVIK